MTKKLTALHKAAAVLLLGAATLQPAFAAEHKGDKSPAIYTPDVTNTLRTEFADGRLVFVGAKGEIKDQINPQLNVAEGAVVQINLVNGDGAIHDIVVPVIAARKS